MKPRRRAFTLIETLVSISVIGILIALLLPAVQQARASARRVHCVANLHQLGLALHGYHEVHGMLPAGSYVLGPSFSTQTGWGWGAMTLPFLEQEAIFRRLHFSQGTAVGTNADQIRGSIPVFRCPADTSPPAIVVTAPDLQVYTAATGNYAGNKAVLPEMSHLKFGNIRDGLSNTFLLGERVYQPSISGSDEFTSSWCGQLVSTNSYIFNSIPVLSVNSLHPLNESLLYPHCFSSRHVGGANFAFGDGDVRFVSDSIDLGVFAALGTPQGGEAVEF